jgi:RNA polymerase sigma-70 factor (ECF subfamily)
MTDLPTTHHLAGTESHRPDLLAFCYRMLGSLHEAEILVGAVRERVDPGLTRRSRWYAEATDACLATLEEGSTRPLPTGLGPASPEPEGDLDRRTDVLWLEPVPDSLLEGTPGGLHLELVAALQYVPPRERAALVLRDHSGLEIAEVAELLHTSTASVTDLLEQGRRRLDAAVPTREQAPESLRRELLARWAAAFEAYDVDAITRLLTDDAVWEMPPFAAWFRGATTIGRLIRAACPAQAAGDQVMVPVQANGQPGFALYMLDPQTGAHRAFQIQVLTLTAAGVVHAVAFFDLTLFDAFGLPQLLSDLKDSQPPSTYAVTAPAGDQRER